MFLSKSSGVVFEYCKVRIQFFHVVNGYQVFLFPVGS